MFYYTDKSKATGSASLKAYEKEECATSLYTQRQAGQKRLDRLKKSIGRCKQHCKQKHNPGNWI